VTISYAPATDCSVFELRIERGDVRFLVASRYEQNLEARVVRNGVPADTVDRVRIIGFYERLDTTLRVRYPEAAFGQMSTRTYLILDGGKMIRAAEAWRGVGFTATYEYVRR
jgi:hypothetical protein